MSEPESVTVSYFGAIQSLVPRRVEAVTLSARSTVRSVLEALAARHGAAITEALVGPDGDLLPNTLLMLNGSNVLHREGLETVVEAGAALRVVVLPAFTGGG